MVLVVVCDDDGEKRRKGDEMQCDACICGEAGHWSRDGFIHVTPPVRRGRGGGGLDPRVL